MDILWLSYGYLMVRTGYEHYPKFFPKCFLYENLCIWIFFCIFASKIDSLYMRRYWFILLWLLLAMPLRRMTRTGMQEGRVTV